MADPLTIGAILLPALLNLLGLGGDDATQERQVVTESQPRGYQSPTLGALDPFMGEQLLRNLQMFSGAGMSGGVGNLNPNITELIKLLSGETSNIMDRYGGASNRVRRSALPQTRVG